MAQGEKNGEDCYSKAEDADTVLIEQKFIKEIFLKIQK